MTLKDYNKKQEEIAAKIADESTEAYDECKTALREIEKADDSAAGSFRRELEEYLNNDPSAVGNSHEFTKFAKALTCKIKKEVARLSLKNQSVSASGRKYKRTQSCPRSSWRFASDARRKQRRF
ncbi:MAG: hypothetical protein LBU13_10975 [Synergistaceae bacterium]|jgi:hypothetical protein|nr:hypothetical protein [Synergistaceae bacterium]